MHRVLLFLLLFWSRNTYRVYDANCDGLVFIVNTIFKLLLLSGLFFFLLLITNVDFPGV